MQEKRRLKRRHLIYYLRVYNGNATNPIGFMADIHEQGLMLISDQPFEKGTIYDFKMELPQEIAKKTHIEFSVKSLWSKKGINSDFYESGFSIEHIDEDTISTIDSIIKFFGFRD